MTVSDDQLLRMLEEVGEVEPPVVLDVDEPLADAAEAFDPCSHCGEPAEYLGECAVCEGVGCLPPDLWSPGMEDPCLTLCVRCARNIHKDCSVEDEAGNPRCERCAF